MIRLGTQRLHRILDSRLIACVACTNHVQKPSCLSLDQAVRVIRATRSGALVFHAPLPRSVLHLVEDFQWTFVDLLERLGPELPYVLLANTGGATTASEAIAQARAGASIFGDLVGAHPQSRPVIKLEVLDRELQPVNDQVIEACRELVLDGLAVVPMIAPSRLALRECVRIGAPAVRLLAGRIGSLAGIEDPVALATLVRESNVPIIFEGAIASPDHVRRSLHMGAAAVLINTAFHRVADPEALAVQLREAADSVPPRYHLEAAQGAYR